VTTQLAFPGSGSIGANACNGGSPKALYNWVAPFSGSFVFSTIGSEFDTVLTLHASCLGPSIACNDDSFQLTSRVTHFLDEGQSVIIEIAPYGGFDEDLDLPEPGFGWQYSLSIRAPE
jgi:hypothetical protein